MARSPDRPGQMWSRMRRHYRDDRGVTRTQVAVLVGATIVLLSPLLVIPMFIAATPTLLGVNDGGGRSCGADQQPGPSQAARSAIPADYLQDYKKAGEEYGIPWNVLAGIGAEETDHGRSNLPGVHSGHNFAGAMGPMQFLPATWREYGVDGDHDGKKNPYDPADAIPAAARYLKANGAPAKMWGAIWHYNHEDWYVSDVLRYASEYADGLFTVADASTQAVCVGNADLGAVPGGIVGEIIGYAKSALGDPYVWGGVGPNSFDCSGLLFWAFRQAGIDIPRTSQEQWKFGPRVPNGQEQPGDFVFFHMGADGPQHVGMVIGDGKMIEAPHTGDVVKIISYRGDSGVVGFTRPLANPAVKRQLAQEQ